MKKYPALQCSVLSLWVAAASLVANNSTASGFELPSGIASVNTKKWPRPKSKESGCVTIQGRFRNEGEDAPSNNRGSRFPPELSFDVLRGGKPGTTPTVWVEVETPNDMTLRFRFIDASGEISETKEFRSLCENGWRGFNFTLRGVGESYRGISIYNIRFTLAEDGALLAHVAINSSGKDFYFFPRKNFEQFDYLFLRGP